MKEQILNNQVLDGDDDSLEHVEEITKLANEQKFYNRAIQCLEFFGKDLSEDVIYISSGDNSIICNPNTEWKEFLGHSIRSIAEYVAKIQNKKINYKQKKL